MYSSYGLKPAVLFKNCIVAVSVIVAFLHQGSKCFTVLALFH